MLSSRIKRWYRKFQRELVPLNRIEINREKLLENYDAAKKLSHQEVWPVLKANAYGHGLEQVAVILKERRFEYIIVDSYYEALKIWNVSNQKVLLIGPILPYNYSKIDWSRVTIMVQSVDQIRELAALGKKIKIHLKINTGMNRQGIEVEEVAEAVRAIKMSDKLRLEGVMSHLADADNDDNSWTEIQENNFRKAIELIKIEGLKPKYFHLAATAGMTKTKLGELNAIRLGLGLYQQTLRMVSTIIKVRKVKRGEKVSYGGIYKFDEDSFIGIIPVGYYEGLDRRLVNNKMVKYKNNYYPIVGRICMNMCVVNFGMTEPNLYGEVEIIGKDREDSIEEMAKLMGTISYEVLVKLSESVRREIV